jgi:uncharacterized repeat protein (TIGR04138 family)
VPIKVPIDRDVACSACGYNLLGLQSDQSCPECGQPVETSARLADPLFPYHGMAAKTGWPMEAFMVVATAVSFAIGNRLKVRREESLREGKKPPNSTQVAVNAADICEAFGRHVRRRFGPNVPERLRALGIERSEDVGRIVFAMAEMGYFGLSNSDRSTDFDGLFTLESLLTPDQ